MTPHEALAHLRTTIESQGPDTPNRHYGRKQWEHLIECCDTLQSIVDGDDEPVMIIDLLSQIASLTIEDEDDPEILAAAWLTADDITARLRARLVELKYWWTP